MTQARLRTVLTVAAAVVFLLVVWRAPQLLDGSSDAGTTTTDGSSQTLGTDPASGLPWVALSSLPDQASDTLARIDAGSPFPYDQDGGVFYNNEQNLPDHERGYYHEYTVDTPGSSNRGARRIVAGGSGELYWTEDHYDSFERIQR